MEDFPSIDRIDEILGDLAEAIPDKYFKGLNGGIVLLEEAKLHPEDLAGDLYVMGDYQRLNGTCTIRIYYGSFKRLYTHLSEDELRNKLDGVLKHELTHHLEYRAGLRDLEIEDANDIHMYKKMKEED